MSLIEVHESLVPFVGVVPMPAPCRAARAARLCRLIECVAAAAVGVPLVELRAPTRGPATAAFARQTAIYLVHVLLGESHSATGRLFNRDRTTTAHACERIEECRDDPALDRLLQRLESVCGGVADRMSERGQVRS